ncbi:MAG: ACT domain-containing protein [Chloroflexota bacterium]|nr:ACT domain-containing protein [Chloroflexota bacterium]
MAVVLEDRPGTLAKAAAAIADAGINIEGFCAVPSGTGKQALFHVLTKDPSATRRVIEKAGFTVKEERDFVIVDAGEDRPGFLAKLLRSVADAEINLGTSYVATNNRVAISADDIAGLRQAVQQSGMTATKR